MAPADLEQFKKILLETKVYLEKELAHHPVNQDMGNDVEGHSSDEEADEAEELPVNYATRAALKERLAAVKDALAKIEKGGYGQCERCQGGIEPAVLTANPESWYCKACKSGR